jgi:hypothetical protein
MAYDLGWYEGLRGMRPHNEKALWGVFAHLGRPGSFCDFGCGDGWLVYIAQTAGVPVSKGIEVTEDVIKVAPPGTEIITADLGEPCDLGHGFELTTSWEVGEHLPEEVADVFVANIARHTSKYLVFTAAEVGQGGYHHINCQDQPYWREKFELQGLAYDKELTDALRLTWQWTVGPLIWLPRNVQVFARP